MIWLALFYSSLSFKALGFDTTSHPICFHNTPPSLHPPLLASQLLELVCVASPMWQSSSSAVVFSQHVLLTPCIMLSLSYLSANPRCQSSSFMEPQVLDYMKSAYSMCTSKVSTRLPSFDHQD